VFGEVGGIENVTLLSTTVPPHNHSLNAGLSTGTTTLPGPTLLTGNLAATDGDFYVHPTQPGFTAEVMNASTLPPQGGNLPHNNIQPSLGINYLIALVGIYPSRN
jgi:microcystin-dependent protein